jgi:hypothetical protein
MNAIEGSRQNYSKAIAQWLKPAQFLGNFGTTKRVP